MESIANLGLQAVENKSCPICEARHSEGVLLKLKFFNVLKCSCGARFINPCLDAISQALLYQSVDLLKEVNPALEDYYEYEAIKENTVTHQEHDRSLRAAESFVAEKTLLEVGCGSGSFLRLAKKRNWITTGIDTNDANVNNLNALGIEAFASDFLNFEDPKGRQFDLIVFGDIIEHLQNPQIFLTKAKTLLKEKGIILISTPNYPNLLSIAAEALYKLSFGLIKGPSEKLYMLEHTSYLGEKQLKHLVGKNGFKSLKSWKTETDLSRYRFSPQMKLMLKFAFLIARIAGLQNRIHLAARKC